MKGIVVLTLALLCGSLIRAFAQSPPATAPGSRVSYFVGRWQFEQEIAGGKHTKTETCAAFGGDHVICEAQGTSPLGPYTSHTVISYDAAEKTFARYTITSQGLASYARGTVTGETWAANTDFKLDGRSFKAQVVWTEQSPTSQVYKMLGSIDGSPTLTLEQATGTRLQ